MVRVTREGYLTMWIKHGRKVKDVSYEYIVIPKCHEEEINDYYRKSGIRIIENSDSIQCVKRMEQPEWCF